VSIAAPAHRDADGVGTAKLSRIAGRKVAVLLVGRVTVAAVIPVITLLRLVNALFAVGTTKFVQPTRCSICGGENTQKAIIIRSLRLFVQTSAA